MQNTLLQRHLPSDTEHRFCYWHDRHGYHCREYWHDDKCTRKEEACPP